MDLIQDNMYSDVQRGRPGIRLSLNQIRKVFASTVTAKDAPIRTFIAALVSYRLIFGDKPERLEPIFEVPGFLKDFAAFQRSSLEEHGGNWYSPVCLREDPRIRGFHGGGVARKGFHICSFHVHEEGDTCSSVANHETVTLENGRADDERRYCLEHGEIEERAGSVSTNGEILR